MQKHIIKILCVLLAVNLIFSGYLFCKMEHATVAYTSVKEVMESETPFHYIGDISFDDCSIGIGGLDNYNGLKAFFYKRQKKGNIVEYRSVANGFTDMAIIDFDHKTLSFALDETPKHFQELYPDI